MLFVHWRGSLTIGELPKGNDHREMTIGDGPNSSGMIPNCQEVLYRSRLPMNYDI